MPTLLDLMIGTLELLRPAADPPAHQPEARADSAVVSSTMGFGVAGKDRITDVTPASDFLWWSQGQLRWSFMRGGIMRRLCLAPPADAMRGGFTVTTESEAQEKAPAHLRLEHTAKWARQLARGFRGSVVYIRVPGDQKQPLGDGPHEIKALHVLMPEECTPSALSRISDPDDPEWTTPQAWDLKPIRPGLSFQGESGVHASRLIVVPGMVVPPNLISLPNMGFQAAVLDVYWEPCRDLGLITRSTVSLMTEASVPVYEVESNAQQSGAEGSGWLDKLRQLRRATSVLGAIRLPPGWKMSRLNAQLTGWRDSKLSAYEDFAAVEGMPPAALIGTPPTGMTSDDQASRRTYHLLLDGQERPILADIILRVHEVAFGPDETRAVVWPSLETPTAVERAQISQALALRDVALLQAQVVERSEVRLRHLGDKELEHVQRDTAHDAEVEDADDVTAGDLAMLADLNGEPMEPEVEPEDEDEPTEEVDDESDDEEDDDEEDSRADAETYRAPVAARNNARRVLRWRQEHGDAVQGMTAVGWTRARQLAGNEPLSRKTVGRMAAFARHRKNAKVAPEFKSEPWRDAGHVAWLGWGGTSGVDWAARIVASGE